MWVLAFDVGCRCHAERVRDDTLTRSPIGCVTGRVIGPESSNDFLKGQSSSAGDNETVDSFNMSVDITCLS